MSIRKYYNRQFSQSEWDNADDLMKVYIHLIEPHKWPVSGYLEDLLKKYKTVWGIMCAVKSPRNRIVDITYALDIGERQAYSYMKQCNWLFGEVLDVDPWVEKRAMYDKLIRIADKAEAEGDNETAMKANVKAIELLERIEANTPREAKIYQPIKITTDPAALKSRLPENVAEDAEFETLNLNDGTIPQPEATEIFQPGDAV